MDYKLKKELILGLQNITFDEQQQLLMRCGWAVTQINSPDATYFSFVELERPPEKLEGLPLFNTAREAATEALTFLINKEENHAAPTAGH